MKGNFRTGSTPVTGTKYRGVEQLVARRAHNPNKIQQTTKYRGIEQLVARRAHNPEVGGSSPPPATNEPLQVAACKGFPFSCGLNFAEGNFNLRREKSEFCIAHSDFHRLTVILLSLPFPSKAA